MDALQNLRDVGGLPTVGGPSVKAGVLYRSDAPRAGDLPPDLAPWPPRTVVDLRAPDEEGDVHPLTEHGARVHRVSLMRSASPARLAEQADDPAIADLGALYRGMLERAAAPLVEAVRAIALEPGPILVHCTAGKDRTGVVIAATLATVGVPRPAIVADYLRTGEALDGILARIALSWHGEQRDAIVELLTVTQPALMAVDDTAIEGVLDVFESAPGGAAGWLQGHGLERDAIAALRTRLTSPA